MTGVDRIPAVPADSDVVGAPWSAGPPVPFELSVPLGLPDPLLLLLATVLVSMLASVTIMTVGRSVHRSWGRRRERAVKADLRTQLLDRAYRPEAPEWDAWVGGLSDRERGVAADLLDDYLRQLDGGDAARFARLGTALGIGERSRRRIESGGYYERLDALTWLSLLRDAPEIEFLRTHCRNSPRERAAAVRVLYYCDHPDLADAGIDLLLGDSPRPFSVFGIDTLYRVVERDPSSLFARAATDYDEWPPALQQQVLLVVRHVQTVVGGADLGWVVRSLSGPDERTRVEATRALSSYGWNRSLRERVDVESICADPSPIVRAGSYRMLAAWGDDEATAVLRSAAVDEPDERARVTAAEALIRGQGRSDEPVPEPLADAYAWAAEHERFDHMATDVSSHAD